MNSFPESPNTVLFAFNDIENPPDLTVRPMPANILRRLFRQYLIPVTAFEKRQDLEELDAAAREEHERCVQARDEVRAMYCLSNLAVLAKVRGELANARKLAEDSRQLAGRLGFADVAKEMQKLLTPAS